MMMCKSGIAYIFKFIVIFSCIIHSGFKDIFQSAESVWCTQHMETNDVSALKTFCLNTSNQQRIMADIYGSHTDVVLQEGLADALDEDDYDAKLKSLFGVWEDIAPGFWNWFDKNRSEIFKDCLVLSSRQRLGISKRFTTNGLEAKHRLQKKILKEENIAKEVVAVSETLNEWVGTYFKEARRAIRGIGKYRLSIEFEHFYVPPSRWVSWSHERRNQHFQKFMEASPKSFAFKKPITAGKKPGTGKEKRRIYQPEPEVFYDRFAESIDDRNTD